jgi:glyoxylase-like metal-dependent hydrolase (beta-lactamase superfamily II)
MAEVAPGVHRYGTRFINCYLIEEGGRLTLLDTGLPSYVKHLRPVLAKIGRSVTDIDAILLTHCHVDHMGSAKQLQRESSSRVLVHAADAATVRGERKPPIPNVVTKLWRPFLLRYFFGHILPNGGAKYPAVTDLTTFEDGERVDVPGSPRVVHAPGHTAGASALWLEDRKTLFSGDSLVTLDTLTGETGPHVFAPPFTEDYSRAIASLSQLESLEADVTLPGHGEPWTAPISEATAIARSRAQR